MSWQDELRQLDAELADKLISPAEYRSRRDHLLAAASGGMPPNTNAPAPQRMTPAAPQEQQPRQALPQVVPPWSPVTDMPTYQAQGPYPQAAPQYPPHATLDDEIFNVRKTKAKRSKAPVFVVIIVLMLLGLAAGWWFGIRPLSDSPATTTAQKVTLETLPQLPGQQRSDNAELSVAEAQTRGLFDARQADFLTSDKVTSIAFAGSTDKKLNYVVFGFNTDSADLGTRTAKDLIEYQKLGGLVAADQGSLPTQVKVVKLVAADQVQYRAVYASGRTAMMVAVAQVKPADEAAVATALREATTSILAKAPAS